MSLWVLDTDTLSLLFRGHARVVARVADKPSDQLAVSIITVEELLSGWYARIRHARTDDAIERAYLALQQSVQFIAQVHLLPFDKPAIVHFNRLRRLHRRIGTNDLRIAAISIQNRATLVTRNKSDFSTIDGLGTENWAD